MKVSMILIFCFWGICTLANTNYIPIPDQQAKYEEKDIVTDSETGDKIVCNQIIMIFSKDVTKIKQQNIMNSFRGRIVGGIPEMNAYQVSFNNTSSSVSKVKNLCKQLEKNKYVLYASPRVISTGHVNKMKLDNNIEVERKGSIKYDINNNSHTHNNELGKLNNVNKALLANKGELAGCIKRKYNMASNYHGEILIRISIAKSGQISDVQILQSNIKDKIVTNCIKNKIRKWNNFPKHNRKNPMQVEFTFKF